MCIRDRYKRDVAKGLPIHVPVNYYPNDDPEQPPLFRWRAHAHLLYENWLNYYVYQMCIRDSRDFVHGDYLSGTIRMIDALLIAASIAIGTGLVLSLYSLLTGVVVA